MSQNAAKTMVTIFAPDGSPIETNRLNALDLTRLNGYRWKDNVAFEPAKAPAQKAAEVEDTPEKEDDSGDEEPAKAPAQPSIDEEAKDIADFDNVEDYLNTFEPEALRTMLEEKFGEKTHPLTGKPKLIAKYIELHDMMDAEDA